MLPWWAGLALFGAGMIIGAMIIILNDSERGD